MQVRVVSFDPSKRRLGLSMRPYVEPSADDAEGGGKPGGRRQGGGGRRGRDQGDDDAEFKLSDEELAGLGVDYEGDEDEVSVFAQALARAEAIQKQKKETGKYEPLLL